MITSHSQHPVGAAELSVGAGRRETCAVWLVLLIAGLPSLLDAGAVGRAAALHAFADGPHPYVVLAHGALLYLWAPLVVLSAILLFLTPGLLLALALDRARDVTEWVLYGLAASIVVVSATAALMQAASGAPLRGPGFGWFVAAVGATMAVVVRWRGRRGARVSWPFAAPHAWWTTASMIVVPLMLLVVLAPKFYWEAFNGDGAHTFETARRLLVQPMPFWPRSAGGVAHFPGFTSMLFAFPSSWFIRMFGEVEASVRLPLLMYLPALFAAIVALAGHTRQPLARVERTLIWLGVVVYTVTMAFSATYDPYLADIADPTIQDTLLVVCFLGFVLAFARTEPAWICLWAFLCYVSRPSGLLVMILWLAAVLLVERPRPWSRVRWVGVALGMCVVGFALLDSVIVALDLPLPGGEHGFEALLRHFYFLQFTDFQRLLYAAIPAGIFPLIVLPFVRRHDEMTKALSAVAAVYFLLFFVQARVALHYFVPAMLLPVVAAWRCVPQRGPAQRAWLGAAAGGCLVALALALPAHGTVQTVGRTVGGTIEDRFGGYDRSAPEQLAASEILYTLFPADWDPAVPHRAYGGSALVWNHYARHDGSAPGAPLNAGVNYVVQRSDAPQPPGTHRVADTAGVALFVYSDAVWRAHRMLRPVTPAGSPWLAVPRSVLFLSGADNGSHVIDVIDVLKRLGIM